MWLGQGREGEMEGGSGGWMEGREGGREVGGPKEGGRCVQFILSSALGACSHEHTGPKQAWNIVVRKL